ncbi:uncharacterized protein LOC114316317 [Camellia sinensis]|uniref:uncharacterized protein LOC114316317 n=1 Tax=Camellia sinensis TaxID=4442 RepID=UPI001035FCEF|nr:uncharacterized protein LOC114316317 [Camellia sinensis]
MRTYKLKMNPLKYAFGVSAGNFLDFLVHHKGIEVDANKAKAILGARPPANKKELQSFLGKVNFLRRFIANLAKKTLAFSHLVKIKSDHEFKWEVCHQEAFDLLKKYLTNPPVLMPPMAGKPLKLYISASDLSIGCLLAQENDMGREQAIYYVSRKLNDETRYNSVEKLYLALYFAAIKLRHYLLPTEVFMIAQTDVIKYMLSKPILRGRQGKWILALIEYCLKYMPQKALKGQALADFLVEHPSTSVDLDLYEVNLVESEPWKLMFDGSKTDEGVGAGIVLIVPNKQMYQFAYQLKAQHVQSCNQAEYEALIIGLELAIEFRIRSLQVFGHSQLVIKQVLGEFKCVSGALEEYLTEVKWLTSFFDHITFTHRFRLENNEANEIAQAASELKIHKGAQKRVIRIQKRNFSALKNRCKNFLPILTLDVTEEDWRFPLIKYLSNPSEKSSRQVRFQALNYVIMGDDLFRKAHDGLTLLCIGKLDQMKAMVEAHEGICGAHQASDKMRWLINRGWAMDLIGQIFLASSKTHSYLLVWFTPTYHVNQGTVFNGDEIKEFAKEYGIQILNSSPYYAQANGQAEATNKIVKNTLEKMTEDNPRDWHNLLSEVLWAYRNSKRNSTGTTPHELVYGHDVVLL